MFHRSETSTTHMFCVCRINTLEKYLKKNIFQNFGEVKIIGDIGWNKGDGIDRGSSHIQWWMEYDVGILIHSFFFSLLVIKPNLPLADVKIFFFKIYCHFAVLRLEIYFFIAITVQYFIFILIIPSILKFIVKRLSIFATLAMDEKTFWKLCAFNRNYMITKAWK